MSTVWSDKIDPLLKIGTPLESVGVRNWALTKADALRALENLFEMGVGIAGGDVYKRVNGKLALTHDNWFCDRNSHEISEHYVARSVNHARKYIANYESQGEEFLFALVPTR
jgi:hypothetical protein